MERVPEITMAARVTIREFGNGFYQVVAGYGFMEQPKIPEILRLCCAQGLEIGADTSYYYLSRESLVLSRRRGMSYWRKSLFAFLSRNAYSVSNFFEIPADRVVELGMQVEI